MPNHPLVEVPDDPIVRAARPDPLNPSRLTIPVNPSDAGSWEMALSLLELPGAIEQPWHARSDGALSGTMTRHDLRSEILGNERPVWVHVPAADPQAAGYPVLVLLDGWYWAEAFPIAPTLEALIGLDATVPMATIMVDALDMKGIRTRELGCDPDFVRFLCDELLPWASERHPLRPEPAVTTIAGQSLGGLTAAFAGLERPDVFGNVIAQSGAFWWRADTEFDLEREALARSFAERSAAPIRIWMEVGLLEGADMVPTNRHLRDVLIAKGYDVTYREYHGGHDWVCWRGGLADALVALFGRTGLAGA
jgi:enterochelin esterase family protein